MQILANALPGFRDLRGPVIAGYFWLLFVFLLVTPDFGRRPSDHVAASLYDLGGDVGRLGVGVALSVAAYLIGAVSQEVSGAIAHAVRRSDRLATYLGAFSRLRVSGSYGRVDEVLTRGRAVVSKESAIVDGRRVASDKTLHGGEVAGMLDLEQANRRTREEVSRELSMPATLLVGDRPELFAEVDRLRAEGELRITVSLPLLALVILLGAVASPWWLLGLGGVVLIFRQGVERDEESRKVIADAMAMNIVESPALAEFSRWVEDVLPERAKALATVSRYGHATDPASLSATERKSVADARRLLENTAMSQTVGIRRDDPATT